MKMNRIALLATSFAAVLISAAVLLQGEVPSHSGAPNPSGAPLVLLPRWVEGRAYRYHVEVVSNEARKTPLFPDVVRGALDFEGLLTLHPTRRAYGWSVDAELSTLDHVDIELLGSPPVADIASLHALLVGHSARAHFDHRYRLVRIEAPRDAPPVFQHLMRFLLTETELVGPRRDLVQKPWHAKRSTTRGRVKDRYEAIAMGSTVEVQRKRRYEGVEGMTAPVVELHHTAHGTIDEAGQLTILEVQEKLKAHDEAGRTLDSVLMVSIGLVAVSPSPGSRSLVPVDMISLSGDAPEAKRKVQRGLDESQAAGLREQELIDYVRDYRGSADPKKHAAMLWRSVAFLRLHPDAAEALANLASSPTGTDAERSLAFDLLAQAGSPACQSAMIEALGKLGNDRPENYHLLVQRLSLIEAPTSNAMAFLGGLREDDSPAVRAAGTYAVGAVAGRRARQGDEAAATLLDDLAAGLTEVPDGLSRRANVAALGNSKQPKYLNAVLAQVRDEDPMVRYASVRALGKLGATPSQLLDFAHDSSEYVQAAVLGELKDAPLSAAGWATLEELSKGDGLTGPPRSALVHLLVRHASDPSSRRIARDWLTRSDLPPALRAELSATFGG